MFVGGLFSTDVAAAQVLADLEGCSVADLKAQRNTGRQNGLVHVRAIQALYRKRPLNKSSDGFVPDDYEDLAGKRRRLYMSSTLSPSAIGAIIQA